jgi:hypothetical protein
VHKSPPPLPVTPPVTPPTPPTPTPPQPTGQHASPPPLPVQPAQAREVELTPTPTPVPAQAVEIAAKQGKIRLEPKTVTPQRLAVDSVADFIGEVRAMKQGSFGDVLDGALNLDFD